jgi:hypothetical protein
VIQLQVASRSSRTATGWILLVVLVTASGLSKLIESQKQVRLRDFKCDSITALYPFLAADLKAPPHFAW